MSIKTETIEVRRCDFCINTGEARSCQHCEKDACGNCGRIYKLTVDYWNPKPGFINLASFSPLAAIFSAFFCHDCAKSELISIMLRFGFDEHKAQKADTA